MTGKQQMAGLAQTGTLLLAAGLLTAGLLLSPPAVAQLKLGDTTNSASGTISTGYTATYSNVSDSTHGWTFGGVGSFNGSYYSPRFLTYNINPYLNQSRANSSFQSITNSSGINAGVSLFSGSQYPGNINYSDAYNSDGNYAVPGLSNFVTHGNSQSFGVNWSAMVSDWPSLSAGYQFGNSSYTVYGANDQGKNRFHNWNVNSSYSWMGFNMGAYYNQGGGHSDIPNVIAGPVSQSDTSNSSVGITVGHQLPLHGSASAGFNRSSWSSDYLGYSSDGTINTVTSVASIHPKPKFAMSGSLNYSDNLNGQLIQAIIGVGGVPIGVNSSSSSSSFDVQGVATYSPMTTLQTSAFAERRSQEWEGTTYGLNSYGGGAAYSRRLLNGSFNGSFTLTANASDKTGTDSIGFSGNGNYSTEMRGWHMNGSLGYSQNAQTLLVTYMNSFYNYSGAVHRNWRYFNLSLGAGGSHSALTDQNGTNSSSQAYSAGLGYGPWLAVNGTYTKSSGQALATGGGLVPLPPIPSPILPPGVVSLYGGESYAFGLGSTPTRGLTISASWSKSLANTTSLADATTGDTLVSSNATNQFNTLIQYQFRKLYFTSGYARLEQGFTQAGAQPEIVSTYYMGISRWFKFF